MIPLHFEKTYKHPRIAEPCTVAIPFKKGVLKDETTLVITKDHQVFPSQCKVTSRWEDHSIRWVFIRFLADLPANQSITYYCETTTTQKPCFNSPLQTTYNEDILAIDTGQIHFTLQPNQQGLFNTLTTASTSYTSECFTGPHLQDTFAMHYATCIKKWEVIEQGPICTIIQGKGYHYLEGHTSLKYDILLTAYANKPWLEVAYTLTNTTPEPISIMSLDFQFNPTTHSEDIQSCVASSNYQTTYINSENGETIQKLIDADSLIYEANEHIAEVFYGTLFANYQTKNTGLCATIYQAHQNFPKAVSAGPNGLTISIIPTNADPITLQSGMARQQKMLLHFHDGSEPLSELNNRSLIYQMPDRPTLDPRCYQEANVFEDVFVAHPISEVEIALINKADSHSRCYGMLNWGDSPDPGYTLQGRGGGDPVWTNNEYDYPHACALLYARTGIRRFLDYLLVSGRHWIDVDICHYSNNPLLYQGQWEHTNGHCIDGHIVCSHQWVEGLLDYYHFTGDQEALEAAIGIGHNVQRLLDTPMFQQKGEINARETGWALRSLVALYKETYDEQWLTKCDWIVGHFEDWEKEYGHWLSPYTDNTAIRVVFMIAIAVGSLMRYYRIQPQDRIRDMILRSVDDLLENALLDNGLFYYKELPSLKRLGNNTIILEALTIAYELTGDLKYLQAGIPTFKSAISNTSVSIGGTKKIVGDALITNGPGTKSFAQSFWPLTTFYKAATTHNLL